uniref:hypothetical protein n=1 Tax=Candidatus Fimivicinus sp. TaxID=3056640 RepID=UPI003FF0AB9C
MCIRDRSYTLAESPYRACHESFSSPVFCISVPLYIDAYKISERRAQPSWIVVLLLSLYFIPLRHKQALLLKRSEITMQGLPQTYGAKGYALLTRAASHLIFVFFAYLKEIQKVTAYKRFLCILQIRAIV